VRRSHINSLPERFGGLEIDDQLVLDRRLYRQVSVRQAIFAIAFAVQAVALADLIYVGNELMNAFPINERTGKVLDCRVLPGRG
jgi:hypothetical protein